MSIEKRLAIKDAQISARDNIITEKLKEITELKRELNLKKYALIDIAKAESCKVCRCQQIEGKTYDGWSFSNLQQVAKRALKK